MKKAKENNLVIIAGRNQAKVFRKSARPNALRMVTILENSDGRQKDKDLRHHSPGLARSGYAKARAPHALLTPNQSHENAAVKFARAVAKYAWSRQYSKEQTSISVAAEPRLLGYIKAAYSHFAKLNTIRWIPKDLVKMPTKVIARHLVALKINQASAADKATSNS